MSLVELVGSGPAVEAIRDALSDTDATVERREQLGGDGLGVVVDSAGSSVFERADGTARGADRHWCAVELGGIGGVPVVEASVVGFGPSSGCYDCLRARVESTVEQSAEPVPAPSAPTQRFAGALAGRIVAEALDDPSTLAGQIREVPHAERSFLPVPGCGCGEGRDWHVTDDERSDPDSALERAERGLDDRVGLVTEVGEAESFPAPYYLARTADTAGFSDATAARQAAGVALDWDTAFMKSLGEGYERYAAGVYRVEDLPVGRATELGSAVSPSSFVTPGRDADDARRRWVPGEDLTSSDEVLLPAETVLYPPPSNELGRATTTGLGLGNSGPAALLSGLYEVVERDAAMLAWYSTYEPLGLAVESEGFDTLRQRAVAEGLDVTPLLLTQDVDVPVVAVVVEQDDWPAFALGSAADLDPAAAATDALAEALQNWMELRGMGPADARDAEGAIGRYAQSPGQATAFVNPETTVPATSVGPDIVPDTAAAEFETLRERVVDAGLTPYASRLTTRDIDRLGFEAVRVCCPSAQPLFFGDAYFGDRAETVPDALGFEPRLRREHHPFP